MTKYHGSFVFLGFVGFGALESPVVGHLMNYSISYKAA